MGNESTNNIQQQLIEQTFIVYLWTFWTPINPWQNQGSKPLKIWDPIPRCSMYGIFTQPFPLVHVAMYGIFTQ